MGGRKPCDRYGTHIGLGSGDMVTYWMAESSDDAAKRGSLEK